MQIVDFEVSGIGKFRAKSSLTIFEESQLESRIDDLMDGKYYETKARAQSLAETHKDIADEIFTLIFVMQIIATLEFVVIAPPSAIVSFRDLSDYKTLFDIYSEYKKKVEHQKADEKKS